MKNRILIALVVLDLFWSAVALVYDYPAIIRIPFDLWPFIVICPVFPFLLMLVWLSVILRGKANPFLLAFAALPSLIYGIGALIFYPTIMYFNGFDWLGFGQIFWVLFYSLQGAYLLFEWSGTKSRTHHGKFVPIILVLIFIIVSILIQFFTKTFGYLAFDLVPANILLIEMMVLITINILIFLILVTRLRTKSFLKPTSP